MTNKEILTRLHEFYELRDKYRDARLELIRTAVECGQEQKDAMNGSGAADYLDGYLAGQGVITEARFKSA